MAGYSESLLAPLDLFKRIGGRPVTREYQDNEAVYSQNEKAEDLFYIRSGNVKLTVTSKGGKKAIIAILRTGDFFGENCLAKGSLRLSSATAIQPSNVARITRGAIARGIHQDPVFARLFITHMVLRIGQIQQEFVDQVFSSSEKRLARILLTMAAFDDKVAPDPIFVKVSQETLAEMVGTTRSRVSYFMNRFRKLGYIDYNGSITVHPGLLTFLTKQ
jgi:CRP-like cAMP-binding protein